MPKPTVSVLDLKSLQAAAQGVDAEAAGQELDAQIRDFMLNHTPTDEHFRKRVTI